jgi:hypothetical protein
MANGGEPERNGERSRMLLLLLIPMLVLYVPLYNSVEPTLFGFPFFYWFQLLWIFVSMAVTAIVYYATEPRSED